MECTLAEGRATSAPTPVNRFRFCKKQKSAYLYMHFSMCVAYVCVHARTHVHAHVSVCMHLSMLLQHLPQSSFADSVYHFTSLPPQLSQSPYSLALYFRIIAPADSDLTVQLSTLLLCHHISLITTEFSIFSFVPLHLPHAPFRSTPLLSGHRTSWSHHSA